MPHDVQQPERGPGRGVVWMAGAVGLVLAWAGAVLGGRTIVQINTNWDAEMAAADPTFRPLRIAMRDGQPGDPLLTVNNFLGYLLAGDYDQTLMHRWVPGFVVQGGGFAMNYDQYATDFVTIAADAQPLWDWGYYPDPDTGQPAVVWADPNYFAQMNLLGYDPTGENQNFEAWFFRNVALNAVEVPAGPPIVNQFDARTMSNTPGTLAMAKLGNDPDSATNEYFFNLADNSANLDHQNGGFTVFADVIDEPGYLTGMALFDWLADHLFGVVNLSPDGYFTDGSASPYGLADGYRDTSPLGEAPVIATFDDQGNLLRLAPLVVTSMQILSGSTFNPLPGDFTADGVIDQDDLTVLLAGWGAAEVPAGWNRSFDGRVDQNELNDLLAHWGVGTTALAWPLEPAGTAAAVPAPPALGVVLVGLAGLLRRPGRGRRPANHRS